MDKKKMTDNIDKAVDVFKFQFVLDDMDKYGRAVTLDYDNHDTIRQALRIAQAVMEPSSSMLQAGINANVGPRSSAHNYIFRAMIEQMMKEVDKG